MVHDDVLVVPRNLLICFMSSLCVLWLPSQVQSFWVAAAALARKFLMPDFMVAVAKRSWSSASLVCASAQCLAPP